MIIKLIIFDLDNVLVDLADIHFNVLNQALINFGHEPISYLLHLTTFNGLPTKEKLQLYGLNNLQSSLVKNEKQKLTAQAIINNLSVDAQKIELLDRLQKIGIVLGCYTNSIRATLNSALSITGMINYFYYLKSNEDVDKPKPDPQGYIEIINQSGFDPKEVLIIEDSPFGLQAARDSGANVLPVKDPSEVTFKNIYEALKDYGAI